VNKRHESESESKTETEEEKLRKQLKLAKLLAYAPLKPPRYFEDLAFTDDMEDKSILTQHGPLTEYDAGFGMTGGYGPAGSLKEDLEEWEMGEWQTMTQT
jgi:hypothetical protein